MPVLSRLWLFSRSCSATQLIGSHTFVTGNETADLNTCVTPAAESSSNDLSLAAWVLCNNWHLICLRPDQYHNNQPLAKKTDTTPLCVTDPKMRTSSS